MTEPGAKPLNRFQRHVPAQYFWPVLLLLATCFGCILILLFFTTDSQDDLQIRQEREAAASALQAATVMARRDLEDYAKWDESVRKILFDTDADWMADNVATYLGNSQGYRHIFVLDGQDRTIYTYSHGKRASGDALQILGPEFRKGLDAVRRMPTDGQPILSGFTRSNGQVMLYAVAAIVPLTDKIVLPPGPTHMLAIARPVDTAFVQQIGSSKHLAKLALNMRKPDRQAEVVAIPDGEGRPLAWLGWTPARPGTELRHAVFPTFLLVAALALIVAGLIVRRGGRTIEALRQSEGRALHHAHHDTLTGLPNRRALVGRIHQALEAGQSVALLYMDLDGFKDANDVYGHAAGDELLREAAARIREAADGGLVARAGGDEFAVLFVDPGRGCADAAAERILAAFDRLFAVSAYRIQIGISIGSAHLGNDKSGSKDELMRRADVAMYAAKADGKNCRRVYEPRMDSNHDLRVRMEADLRAALEAGEIKVLFQPIVEAATGRIVSVEALSRWHHPVHGDVPPDIFIPLAEMSGLISAVGKHVLRLACREAKPLDVSVAVNLSPAQFWDRRLADEVRAVLRETGFPANRLELEITESYLLRRPDAAAAVIDDLRNLGICIALDDFGTGFASVGYLRQLSFDRLKIDREFIQPLADDPEAAELVAAVAALATALGLEITAEGVENEAQAVIARLAGCTRLQGWLYGRPVDAARLREICAPGVAPEQREGQPG